MEESDEKIHLLCIFLFEICASITVLSCPNGESWTKAKKSICSVQMAIKFGILFVGGARSSSCIFQAEVMSDLLRVSIPKSRFLLLVPAMDDVLRNGVARRCVAEKA